MSVILKNISKEADVSIWWTNFKKLNAGAPLPDARQKEKAEWGTKYRHWT